ncbi:MAG: sugar-binding domain-containing protein, partial [Verrucomicrobiota bacterium]
MKTINVLFLAAVLSTKAFSASSDRDDLKPDYTRFDLNGAWVVSASGSNDWFAATVPGCVHTDLLAANRIPDPFYRDNEKKIQWISELGWTYRRSFLVTEDLLQRKHLLLRCEGLDTLATVLVNGVEVGQADNMYRLWEFDVKKLLKVGSNNIEVRFAPALPFIRSKEAEQHLPTWQYPGAAYIRKMPCNFGWDWGPTVVTCGIWRNIALVAYDTARLDDVRISQDHGQKDKVKLTVQVFTQTAPSAGLKVQLVLTSPDGKPGKPVESTLINGQGTVELTVQRPQLWWPAGMGKQPLYTVKVDLLDAQGRLLDATQRRIGLRTMQVLEQTNSTPMQFVVNGVPYFAKGANWIPADAFPTRSTKAQLRQFMADAVAVN